MPPMVDAELARAQVQVGPEEVLSPQQEQTPQSEVDAELLSAPLPEQETVSVPDPELEAEVLVEPTQEQVLGGLALGPEPEPELGLKPESSFGSASTQQQQATLEANSGSGDGQSRWEY